MNPKAPWYAYPILLFPNRILKNLDKSVEAGVIDEAPNTWQLCLGVLRMWHRVLLRSDTVGTSPEGTIRNNWRARLLYKRPFRFPFLAWERAIAPLDLTGLASSKERIIKHLLGAHHDGNQFIFDIELLSAHEGAVEELARRTQAIVDDPSERSEWLRDLTVFENYHESLLERTKEVLEKGLQLSEDDRWDADISLKGYMSWCAQQPATPAETLEAIRNGSFAFDSVPQRFDGQELRGAA